ncbi:SDR family NAD(P)-dependent oxidoreductase [Pseudoduganella sp. RAF19]|uniref:SDR family NAD(P)-dependent oxidoreductase n=1 Tax=Pseudoduganella sp. RAF19 TaxID=3233052 RepID=UPI003F9B42DE
MNIQNSVVFVTGASRGLGLALAREALRRGAKKVYAGVRDTQGFNEPGMTPVRIDVTDMDSVQSAAAACADTTILINNAGIVALDADAFDGALVETSHRMFNTNYGGILRASTAFAPALKTARGAIVNVLSDATWLGVPMLTAYGASKAAAWSYTNALRLTLKASGVQVLGLHVGLMDTDMTASLDLVKTDPNVVAVRTLDALEANQDEVFGDEGTAAIKASLSGVNPAYLNPPPFGA